MTDYFLELPFEALLEFLNIPAVLGEYPERGELGLS